MRLAVGGRIVYPSQGPCLIGPPVERIINDRAFMFCRLTILDGSGGDLFIPVDKLKANGVRLLLEEAEIPKLLNRLKRPTGAADSWRQRTIDNLKLFVSGTAFDLAEIVGSLTELNETKALSFREHKMLDRARRLLICELSEVTGEKKEEAEQLIDKTLKARIRNRPSGPTTAKSIPNASDGQPTFKRLGRPKKLENL
jgi:RNA polymerase-interacting CarD/CdnL/TRCF family regulator